MRLGRFLARGLASASTGPGTRAYGRLRRAGVGNRGGSRRLWRLRHVARIRGLGGGDAPLVSRRLPGGGVADADCNCRTTTLGTFGAGGARRGSRGGRRRLDRRSRTVRGLAELSAVLGNALPARNRLARCAIGGSHSCAARCRVGG